MLRAVAVCLIAYSSTTASAGVRETDIQRFVESKPSVYGDSSSDEVLRVLLKNLPRPGFDAAVHTIARRWKVSEPAAVLIAEGIMRAQDYEQRDNDAITQLFDCLLYTSDAADE